MKASIHSNFELSTYSGWICRILVSSPCLDLNPFPLSPTIARVQKTWVLGVRRWGGIGRSKTQYLQQPGVEGVRADEGIQHQAEKLNITMS